MAQKKPAKSTEKKASKLDVTGKSADQLMDSLTELKREAFNLRFQAATSQLEKPSRVRQVRRDIARIKTQQSVRAKSATAAN